MENVGNIGFPNVEQMEIHRLVTHKGHWDVLFFWGSHCVLKGFLKFSKSFLKMFPKHHTFIPYALAKVELAYIYIYI
jgi:hypothetical protein